MKDSRKNRISSRMAKHFEELEQVEQNRPEQETAGVPRKKREKKPSPLRRRLVKTVLILLAAFLALVLWMNRDNLHPETVMDWLQEKIVGMGVGDGYPASFVGSVVEKGNFSSENGDLIMVSDTHLTVLNSTAKELISRQHSFSSPVLKTAGTRMLVYSQGGKGYQVETYSKTLKKNTLEEMIFSGTICSDGTYGLLTEAEGYLGMLTVYTPENEQRFRYRFSSCYPVAAAVDPGSNRAVVTGINAEAGALVSMVYVLDMNSSEAVAPVGTYTDTFFFDAVMHPDSSASLIGDTQTVVIPKDGAPVSFDYGGRHLAAYSISQGRTALCLFPYENAEHGELILLDSSGKTLLTIPLEKGIKDVSLQGNTVAVLEEGMIRAYSAADGTSRGTAAVGKDSFAITLRDESSAYVLGISQVNLTYLEE